MTRGRMVVFGGSQITGLLNDTGELLPAPVATWTRYGTGCPGSAGVPALDALPATTPSLGSPFTLRLTSLPPQPGAALLAFGFELAQWNGAGLPLALDPAGLPGCRLWIGPTLGTLLVTHPGGNANRTIAIPANQLLAGLMVATQALVFDGTTSTGLGSVTNAGIMRVY